MAVGEPAEDENGSPKPRLPFEHIFHKNVYNSNKAHQKETLNAYDQMVSKYYQDRTNGVRNETWSQQVAGFLSGKARLISNRAFPLKNPATC
jgi:FMN reductase (NADPH)